MDLLEKRYPAYEGLNLCYETRERIARHATTYDHPSTPLEFQRLAQPSLEAQVVEYRRPLWPTAPTIGGRSNAGFLIHQNDSSIG